MTKKLSQSDTQPSSNGRRTLLDFGPLLLFFGANYLYQDLMFSVKILVVATVISLGLSWGYERRIPVMAAFGCAALVFFAGLTLYFDDELFIKVKPTVLTLIFAAARGELLGPRRASEPLSRRSGVRGSGRARRERWEAPGGQMRPCRPPWWRPLSASAGAE